MDDNVITEEEKAFLDRLARKLDISKLVYDAILEDYKSHPINPPVCVLKWAIIAVNYHKWHICDDACSLGKELQIPIYKFVKEALIRKFGAQWYEELEKIAAEKCS